jgi:hypothetical protein
MAPTPTRRRKPIRQQRHQQTEDDGAGAGAGKGGGEGDGVGGDVSEDGALKTFMTGMRRVRG